MGFEECLSGYACGGTRYENAPQWVAKLVKAGFRVKRLEGTIKLCSECGGTGLRVPKIHIRKDKPAPHPGLKTKRNLEPPLEAFNLTADEKRRLAASFPHCPDCRGTGRLSGYFKSSSCGRCYATGRVRSLDF